MTRVNQKIKKEDLEVFIQEYISEYRTFLENKYPEYKNDFLLYTGHPLHVKAYIDDTSVFISFDYNKPEFKIEISEVNKVPSTENLDQKIHFMAFSNVYITRIISNPQKYARDEILDGINSIQYMKNEEEMYEILYQQNLRFEADATIMGYLNFWEQSYNVKKETLEKHRSEIYNAIQIISRHSAYNMPYIATNCETLSKVNFEITKALESSVFLGLHANYRAANILLRTWLETIFRAASFDYNLKQNESNDELYREQLIKRDEWLEKSDKNGPFTGPGGIVKKLLCEVDNKKASHLLSFLFPEKELNFKESVERVYRDLSKEVHCNGLGDEPFSLYINFVEYNRDLFIQWYNKLSLIDELCNILILVKFPEMIELSEKHNDLDFPTIGKVSWQDVKEIIQS